jgi:hypothetical protein
MTMNASLPAVVAQRGAAITESPAAGEQLELLAEAIRLAVPPAFFTIWQDAPDSTRLFEDVLKEQAGLKNLHFIRPKNLAAELDNLQQRFSSLSHEGGVVLLGCLSPMHDEERKQFNAARDRLLHLPTKIIFVESVADEGKIRLGFPDVVSLVSYDCRLFRRDEEDPFATSGPVREGPDATAEAPSILPGTVHEVREADALCWLEVSPGVRVKFAVPLSLLQHVDPQPGLELLWSPGKEGESPAFWRREPEPPDPGMIREVKELNQRFRDSLKSWRPRLPEDEQRP